MANLYRQQCRTCFAVCVGAGRVTRREAEVWPLKKNEFGSKSIALILLSISIIVRYRIMKAILGRLHFFKTMVHGLVLS